MQIGRGVVRSGGGGERGGERGVVFGGEPGSDEESQGGESGEDVILLTGREAEEDEDGGGPDSAEEPGVEGGGKFFALEGSPEWNSAESFEEKRGPGQKPDEDEAPEEQEGNGVVVVGNAAADVAGELVVDEVEPGESADVAGGGEVSGMTVGGGGERGGPVPGDGEDEEENGLRGGADAEQVPEIAGAGEVEEDDGDGKDESDEALGEDGERGGGGDAEAVDVGGVILGEGAPEKMEGKGDEEGEQDVGEQDAGEDEDAEAGEEDEGGVESGAIGAEHFAAEAAGEVGEGEDGEGEGKASGPDMEAGVGDGAAEGSHEGGHEPVEEGGFFEVADSVGGEGDEVVGEDHLAGGFGVDGVGVVEERGEKEGEGGIEQEPESEDDERVAGRMVGAGDHGVRITQRARLALSFSLDADRTRGR